jgi:hypothetical protein
VFNHFLPEHPLRWQLADFRAGQVSDDTDWLWVRLLDVLQRCLLPARWVLGRRHRSGQVVLPRQVVRRLTNAS